MVPNQAIDLEAERFHRTSWGWGDVKEAPREGTRRSGDARWGERNFKLG